MQTDPTSDVVSKVAVGIVTELFKSAMAGLKSAPSKVLNKGKEYDVFGISARRYAAELEKNYNSTRIFGMNKPIPLRSIYTRVNVLERLTAYSRASAEDLDSFFDKKLRSFKRTRETTDGIACINKYPKVVLLGKPGSGKTTFLKYILLSALDGALSPKSLPIFVSLKDWSDTDIPLHDYVLRQFDVCELSRTETLLKRLLKDGKCILLLDGFDEVTSKVSTVIREIKNFTAQYPECRYLLSCRIAAYDYVFEKFTEIEIADFNNQQIQTFVKNWFYENPKKAALCTEQLFASNTIRELSTIPLLLTMLCLAFDENMSFPRNKSELYKEGIDALLKKWDASRDILRPEIYKQLSLKRKESLLSRIAATTFQKNQYFIKQHQLESQISDYISHLTTTETQPDKIDPIAILKAIEAQHGILVERARGIYSFSHLTFQEYFTAKFIVDNATDGTLRQLVTDHLNADNWREIFIMIATMLDDSNNFLMLLDQEIKQWGHINLGDYLRNLSTNGISDSNIHRRSTKIALAIYYGLQTSPKPANHQLMMPLEIARTLEPNLFPKEGTGSETVIEAIKKDAIDWYALPTTTLDAFETYMKANLLLLECIRSGCYASKTTVDGILSNILSIE